MAKKRRKAVGRTPAMPVKRRLDLSAARSLIEQGQYDAARVILEDFARRFPDRPEVLTELANLYLETRDAPAFQRLAERLLTLNQDDPALLLALSGSYIVTVRPVLALRTFRRFLDRWPDHDDAPLVRQSVAGLEGAVRDLLAEVGLIGDDAIELGVLHEQAQLLLAAGEFDESRRTLERLLRRRPDFVAGINNLSQLDALEGRWREAIAGTRRVLAVDPGNFHALANLTRYYCLAGQIDEAREAAAQLKAVTTDRDDVWTKKAEAFSYLGDDEGVAEAFRGADKAGLLRGDEADPWLYHLAAVASLRLGRQAEAKRRWQRALNLDPDLGVATDNLEDLQLPVGERHGPWPFPLAQWLSQRVLIGLTTTVASLSSRASEAAIERSVRAFVRQHPEVTTLAPLLLDRGDPEGREFAFRIAMLVRSPELLAVVRDFALSQRGPDELRREAADAAQAGGLLPLAPVSMWIKGEWRKAVPLGIEITEGPRVRHRPGVERLAEQALTALQAGQSVEAEQLLQQALQIESEHPDLLNNLAVAYHMQGRAEEADVLRQRILAQHPDYVFAVAGLAQAHTQKKEFDEAAALLEPVLSRPRLHFTEFAALCGAKTALHEAKAQYEDAEAWLDVWEDITPDSPRLAEWRIVVRMRSGFLGKLGGRRRKKTASG